jgi:hypothetical protein
MASKKTKKGGSSPGVTLRFANPRSASMAKKKKTGGSKKPRRSNPKKPAPRRRRRNPGTFAERAGKLAGVAAVALASGALVYVATSKIMPGSNVSLYGIPAATFLVGAAAARTMPTLGVGMAIGSLSPFALPIANKVASLMAPANPTTPAAAAAGIARSMRNMRAVSMGRMGAIDMGAVDMGRAYA